MKRGAIGAVGAQGAQAAASFVLQVIVARALGFEGLGVFAILYGVVVLASGVVTGFVGDSLAVLDRADRAVRAALLRSALILSTGTGLIGAAATLLLGLTTPPEALAFAAATALFCLEEVLRRTLMAELRFWRVAAIDLVGLAAALGALGAAALAAGRLNLLAALLALAAGQTVALVAGALLLPAHERVLVLRQRGGFRTIAAYGAWRSLQQLLRPALLTGVRSAVGVVAGLTATGLLEAARVYVAPALLLVSGLSSFLFASFARDRSSLMADRLRRADRAVVALVGLTVVIGGFAVVLLPVAGPLLFRRAPDTAAVLGWIAYAASVAAVTPYGALAATGGRQAAVLGVRVTDTLVSLGAVAVALALGVDPAWSAGVLAIGSLGGGAAIRFGLLARQGRSTDAHRAAAAPAPLRG